MSKWCTFGRLAFLMAFFEAPAPFWNLRKKNVSSPNKMTRLRFPMFWASEVADSPHLLQVVSLRAVYVHHPAQIDPETSQTRRLSNRFNPIQPASCWKVGKKPVLLDTSHLEDHPTKKKVTDYSDSWLVMSWVTTLSFNWDKLRIATGNSRDWPGFTTFRGMIMPKCLRGIRSQSPIGRCFQNATWSDGDERQIGRASVHEEKRYPLVNEHRPCQIGVGRWVSLKNWWFSGSMLIYQGVTYQDMLQNHQAANLLGLHSNVAIFSGDTWYIPNLTYL